MGHLKGIYKDSRLVFKVLQWMVAVCVLTILAALLFYVIQYLGGISPDNIHYIKSVQALQTISVFLLPPLVVAYLWSDQPCRYLRLQGSSCPTAVWWLVPLSMLVAAPGINLLAYLNQQLALPAFLQPLEDLMKQLEQQAETLTLRFLQVKSFGALLINLFVMALLPAIGEELTFRGLLLRRVTHVTIWAVAILFSAFHFQFYGFVPRMLLGALFGYTLCWTGSLWIPIAMHFTNNAATVIAYWVIYNNNLNPDAVEAFGTGDTMWIGLISFAVAGIGIYFLCRLSRTISNASSRMSWGN